MGKRDELFNDYDGFVEKFKPKKTTDDCYTPAEVYEVVVEYVEERFGVDRCDIVRPFWPGGDYQEFDYRDGCCVVDNPPFSILSEILRFYLDHGIKFFLFCPVLTSLSSADALRVTTIACDARITYDNGAVVHTGFVTNMCSDVVIESSPYLGRAVTAASDAAAGRSVSGRARYDYPDAVVTAARMLYLSAHGVRLAVRRDECCRIRSLDAQRAGGKAIYGGGLLLSRAAERAMSSAMSNAMSNAVRERITWPLSDRELAVQRMLGDGRD